MAECRSLLTRHADCSEEGTRNLVSECLGRLALLEPDALLARLRAMALLPPTAAALGEPSPPTAPSAAVLSRCTALNAVKWAIVDQVRPAIAHPLSVSLPFRCFSY